MSEKTKSDRYWKRDIKGATNDGGDGDEIKMGQCRVLLYPGNS